MSEDRQIALEEESVSTGVARYNDRLSKLRARGQEDQTKPGFQLVRRALGPLTEAIEADRNVTRRGKVRTAVHLIKGLESEALAFHGLRAMVGCLLISPSYTKLVRIIGKSVVDEINFRRFQELEAKSHKMTQARIKRELGGERKVSIMKRMYSLSDITPVKWTAAEEVHVGVYILELLIAVTGWAKSVQRSEGRGKGRSKTPRMLEPTQEFLDWLEQAHDSIAGLSPMRMPMVVEPLPWTGPRGGGYLTDLGGTLSVVKSWNEVYLDALEEVDMPEVYDALNAIQSTPWRVNRFVLDTARAMWEEGVAVGSQGSESLPAREPLARMERPTQWQSNAEWKKEDFKGYQLWAQRASQVFEENRRLFSKRVSAQSKINLAAKFVDEERIYFPHQMDFRGRVYPVPAFLNPQGDDLAKGLLEFAEGKPLGEEGVAWLMVHIANCFGVDKVSFEERIAWTEAHMDALVDSGFDPVGGERFWMTADDPFLALAACRDLLGWTIEGDEYVSHLPIAMDGTCNGLQNFSALLRDAVGGKATNLVPQDKPADIYTEVMKLVEEKIREDAEAGKPEALRMDGFIDRKIVKQPVMTQPYGATLAGMRGQIEDAIRRGGNKPSIKVEDMWSTCGYVAEVTHDAIGRVVIAARATMDWLQETAKIAASEDYPLRWVTPVGLPVLQDYRQMEAERLLVHIDGLKSNVFIRNRGTKLDRRRQRSSISPNLIHSFDAAHMMKTVNLAAENGVSAFAMIHDSYGCHAADIPLLHQCLRAAFVDMYKPDLLAGFKEEIESQLPESLTLPDLPAHGDLDLDVIHESQYFFA